MADGFDIMEPIDIGDLDHVQDKPLLPPTKNVRVTIKRASPIGEGANWKGISLGMQLVDGIEMNGEFKFKGMYINSEPICCFANKEYYANQARTNNKKDYTEGDGHLRSLKVLGKALGITIKRIDDEFLSSLKNKDMLIDIRQKFDDFAKENINVAVNFKGLPDSMKA